MEKMIVSKDTRNHRLTVLFLIGSVVLTLGTLTPSRPSSSTSGRLEPVERDGLRWMDAETPSASLRTVMSLRASTQRLSLPHSRPIDPIRPALRSVAGEYDHPRNRPWP